MNSEIRNAHGTLTFEELDKKVQATGIPRGGCFEILLLPIQNLQILAIKTDRLCIIIITCAGVMLDAIYFSLYDGDWRNKFMLSMGKSTNFCDHTKSASMQVYCIPAYGKRVFRAVQLMQIP